VSARLVLAFWANVGVRVGLAPCWNKLALCRKPKNLQAKFHNWS